MRETHFEVNRTSYDEGKSIRYTRLKLPTLSVVFCLACVFRNKCVCVYVCDLNTENVFMQGEGGEGESQ